MSQSPIHTQGSENAEGFLAAKRKLSKFLQAGMSWSGNERNCCFLNTGSDRFADVSAVSGFDFVDDGRAVATVDWDFDGDLDVWLVNRTGPQVRFLRNNARQRNHFLCVRLNGDGYTTSRDAIGARVEVVLNGDAGERLIKTVRAGEGYLSQSSKWLHFGLGEASGIDRVIVRWPNGQVKEFGNLELNQHYLISQAANQVKPWLRPKRVVDVRKAHPVGPRADTNNRSVLRSRFPLPPVYYTDLKNRPQSLASHYRKPLLVNLWATWCKPCMEELAEFKQHEADLRRAGIHILALNIDAVGAETPPNQTGVRHFVEQQSFPFEVGTANAETLQRLDAYYRAMFIHHPQLPVPTSFLLDSGGRVAVLYKGRVSVETLLEDVSLLDLTNDAELYRTALPFPGREYGRPKPPNLAELAFRLTDDGRFDDAAFYLRMLNSDHLSDLDGSAKASYAKAHYNIAVKMAPEGENQAAIRHYNHALQAQPNFLDAHFNLAVLLAESGEKNEAIGHYQQVLSISPRFYKAHNNLGKIFAESGQFERAISHYEQALKIVPANIDFLNNLGNALVAQKRIPEAIEQFRKALAYDNRHALTHYNLGVALDAQRNFVVAANHYSRAIDLAPNHVLAHNNLGVTLARLGKLDEAEAQLRRAIKLDPNYAAAKKNLQLVDELRKKHVPNANND